MPLSNVAKSRSRPPNSIQRILSRTPAGRANTAAPVELAHFCLEKLSLGDLVAEDLGSSEGFANKMIAILQNSSGVVFEGSVWQTNRLAHWKHRTYGAQTPPSWGEGGENLEDILGDLAGLFGSQGCLGRRADV